MTERGAITALVVRVARRIKGDDSFDIDPALSFGDLVGFLFRRFVMAARGLVLSLRTGSLVFPVFVGRGVRVTGARHLKLAPGVTIDDYCRLDCTGRTGIVLGRSTTLRRGTQIEVTSVMRELGAGITVGDRVGISEGCFIAAKGPVSIGADTIIGPGVRIIAENHIFQSRDATIRTQGVSRHGIDIGTDCWLGAGVTILDDVRIGAGSVIGAGAVVIQSIPELSMAVGVPARVLRTR